jgi:hypothetical protein
MDELVKKITRQFGENERLCYTDATNKMKRAPNLRGTVIANGAGQPMGSIAFLSKKQINNMRAASAFGKLKTSFAHTYEHTCKDPREDLFMVTFASSEAIEKFKAFKDEFKLTPKVYSFDQIQNVYNLN